MFRRYTWSELKSVFGGSRSSLVLLLLLGAACGGDDTGLSTESQLPADTTAAAPTDTVSTPADTIAAPPSDSTVIPDSTVTPDTTVTDSTALPPVVDSVAPGSAVLPGITFGSFTMPVTYLSNVQTGTMLGGPLGPSNIISVLTTVRSKGGRIVIKLCKGADSYVKNSDGTFSFTKWKALVSQYRNVNLGPFITDGTILGHFLIDEPQRAAKWGGKAIPQATVEAMAQYSKQIWPNMTTMVRVVPSWLRNAPITYKYLDTGWLQYAAGKGDVSKLVADEVAAAKAKGLGLVVGMNALAGGNGSSGIISSWSSSSYSMSATEIRNIGNVLLNQSYACAFYLWQHDTKYYGRSDIKAAMADLSAKAKLHTKTSCRQ
jgi:hypothetical protein